MSLILVKDSQLSDAEEIGRIYKKGTEYYWECGDRLIKKKKSLRTGEFMDWLEVNKEELGFSSATARRLMECALTRTAPDWNNDNHRAKGTGENEWFTPAQYIKAARKVLGEIDLDPASHDVAQRIIQAKHYFTKKDNGLVKEWRGKVWLNPPYSQPEIWEFANKLVLELESGKVTDAILLTHNYTDTAWFHRAESIAQRICFTSGRIKFVDVGGKECAPTQGQAFFYYGENSSRFDEVFKEFGFIR